MFKSLMPRNIVANKTKRDLHFGLFDDYVRLYGGGSRMPFEFCVYMPHLNETYITRGALNDIAALTGSAQAPLSAAGYVSFLAAQIAMPEARPELDGMSVMAVSYTATKGFEDELSALSQLGKGGLGVTMRGRTTGTKGDLITIGRIVVPVDGASVNVTVHAEIVRDGTGKQQGMLFLDPDKKQMTPEAQKIADLVLSENIEASGSQEQAAMALLGRGALSLIRELKDGRMEFRKALVAAGLPAESLDPGVILLNGVEAAFTLPNVLKDEYTDDGYLNSLVYPFITDDLEAGVQPFSELLQRSLNPRLNRYSVVDDARKYVDLMKAALLCSDTVLAVAQDSGPGTGVSRLQALRDVIHVLPKERLNAELGSVLNEYLAHIWGREYAQKRAQYGTLHSPATGLSTFDASGITPSVRVGTFSEIPAIARRFSDAGINVVVLPGCLGGPDEPDISRIDLPEEAGRLGMAAEEIDMISNILPDENDDIRDSDGLLENQFYIGFELYHAMTENPEQNSQYRNFAGTAGWWPQVKQRARLLAFQRMNGAPPADAVSIGQWEAKLDGEGRMKFAMYAATYEYMQYVAFQQLKNALSAIHRNERGMKVFTEQDTSDENSVTWIKMLGFDGGKQRPLMSVSSADELTGQRMGEESDPGGKLWVAIRGDVCRTEGLLTSCLTKIAESGMRPRVSFDISSADVLSVNTPGVLDIVAFLKSIPLPAAASVDGERAFSDGFARGRAMPVPDDGLQLIVDGADKIQKAIDTPPNNEQYISAVCDILAGAGLSANVMPAAWNDIRAMSLRAKLCRTGNDLLTMNDELRGYLHGYFENAREQFNLLQSSSRIHREHDVLTTPLSESIIAILTNG